VGCLLMPQGWPHLAENSLNRQRDDDAGTAKRGLLDRHRAAVGADHLVDDRKPETAAALVARAGFVEPHEAFQYPCPLGSGDPRPIVVDREHHLFAALDERAVYPACRTAFSPTLRTIRRSASASPCTRTAFTPAFPSRFDVGERS